MNEVLDGIERAVVAAARRRARRRHRAVVATAVAAGALLLVSGASAVTGVGPIGDALRSKDVLPIGAKPDRGGPQARVALPGPDGRLWEVLFYRQRESKRDRTPGRAYCIAAVSSRPETRRRWRGVTCGSELTRRVARRGLWLHCGSYGHIVGEPLQPGPVCGLAPGDTASVSVSADGAPPLEARLSDPVRADGRLVRVFLAFPDVKPTPPGQRSPRMTITARTAGGATHVGHTGGLRVPGDEMLPEIPSSPPRGTARADVRAFGWRATAWAVPPGPGLPGGTICTTAAPAGREFGSQACIGSIGRLEALTRRGVSEATDNPGPGARRYALFGLVRAEARGLRVTDARGRRYDAALSDDSIVVRRSAADLAPYHGRRRRMLQRLPRALRVRAFVAVLRSPPRPVDGRVRGLRFELLR
jgi:hypothetical protein